MQILKRGLLVLGALLPLIAAAPVSQDAAKAQAISGKYIVKLKDGIDAAQIESHHQWATDLHTRSISRRADSAAKGIEKTYKISNFNAYAGSFDETTIEEIKNSDDVSESSNSRQGTHSNYAYKRSNPWKRTKFGTSIV